jgi:site-specific recombinase XerD
VKLYPTAAHLYVQESGFIKTPTSAKTYLKVMRHLQGQYPDKHVDQFSTQDLAAWCMCLRELGNTDAAGTTSSKRMGHLRGSYRWWRWRGLVDPDPAVDLPLVVHPSKFGRRHHTWLNDAQVTELLASYDATDIFQRRNRLIIMIGLFTGLRLDAIAHLTWDQFDADLTTLRVNVKNDKPVELPVLDELRDELIQWRKLGWLDATAVIPSIREALDPSQLRRKKTLLWGKPLGEAGIYAVVKKAGALIGTPLAPHDMRRSYAGWLDNLGIDLRDIQGLLAHENIATTAGYLEKNPARLRRAVAGLRRSN